MGRARPFVEVAAGAQTIHPNILDSPGMLIEPGKQGEWETIMPQVGQAMEALGGRFAAAALEPHLWDDALRALAQATGSDHAQLIGLGGPASVPFNWINDVSETMVSTFATLDGGSPAINFRIAADLLPGRPDIVHEAHYDVARPLLHGEDYLDFCSDYDIPFGCQTRLVQDRDRMIGFALLRSQANGATNAEQRASFMQIAEHARAAVRLQAAIEHQGFALINGSMEAMARACFLLDGAGQVGAMTSRADALLSRSSLRVRDGRLGSGNAADARRIAQALSILYAGDGLPPPVVLQQDDLRALPGVMLEFFLLPRREWALQFAPRAIVVVREADSAPSHGAATLISTFGLTRAEAEVAMLLAEGMSREAVAQQRGVATETLKSQIRHIYSKTGCSREAQLVRLVTFLTS